jgi:hypothetical protein
MLKYDETYRVIMEFRDGRGVWYREYITNGAKAQELLDMVGHRQSGMEVVSGTADPVGA